MIQMISGKLEEKFYKNLKIYQDYYLHRDCYVTAQNYSKDTFVLIERLGTNFYRSFFHLRGYLI